MGSPDLEPSSVSLDVDDLAERVNGLRGAVPVTQIDDATLSGEGRFQNAAVAARTVGCIAESRRAAAAEGSERPDLGAVLPSRLAGAG